MSNHGSYTGSGSWYEAGGHRALWRWVPEWLYVADPVDPLTFHHPDGRHIRPDNRFKMDFGSIPLLAQIMAPATFSPYRFRKSYTFHDSGYRHKGLWVYDADPARWEFRAMTRREIDDLMAVMIRAEGGRLLQAGPVWLGVRLGGWWGYAGRRDMRLQ